MFENVPFLLLCPPDVSCCTMCGLQVGEAVTEIYVPLCFLSQLLKSLSKDKAALLYSHKNLFNPHCMKKGGEWRQTSELTLEQTQPRCHEKAHAVLNHCPHDIFRAKITA